MVRATAILIGASGLLGACGEQPGGLKSRTVSGVFDCVNEAAEEPDVVIINFDKPDVSYGGGIVSWSETMDGRASVERIAPRGRHSMGTLFVRGSTEVPAYAPEDKFFTMYRTSSGTFRLRREFGRTNFKPAPSNGDPVCKYYPGKS